MPCRPKTGPGSICVLDNSAPDSKILYSTYFGGERNDEPNAINSDRNSNYYIGSRTDSSQFPIEECPRFQLRRR